MRWPRGRPSTTATGSGTSSTTRTSGRYRSESFSTRSVTVTVSPGCGVWSETRRSTVTADAGGAVTSAPNPTTDNGNTAANNATGLPVAAPVPANTTANSIAGAYRDRSVRLTLPPPTTFGGFPADVPATRRSRRPSRPSRPLPAPARRRAPWSPQSPPP